MPDDIDPLLALFDPDPEIAAERYALLRKRLIFFFQHGGAIDPENLADEVISRMLRKVWAGATLESGPNAYAFGVAGNVLLEWRRARQNAELPADLPSDAPKPGALYPAETKILVRQALRNLSPDDRRVFENYHLDDRGQLAKVLNTTPNALRIRVFRIRKRILEELEKSGPRSQGGK